MIHTIKRAFAILSLAIFGSVMLYNCEPDPDTLGEQLFLDGAAQGNEEFFDVIAFNIDNNNNIRSDASQLGLAVLGAFNENQFGMQKANYLTQMRLSTYNPDFGANATVDSVVLVLKPRYQTDSVTTTTDESYVYPDGNVDAKKVVNTYPIVKYGRTKINGKTKFNIKVHEVTDFLRASTDSVRSNAVFAFNPAVLGSKEFNGDISSVTITKDSDNSSLFTSTPGIRIKLDNAFFQDKIIAKKGQPELQDAANFIRHIKGLRISVDETDGYLFQFNPNEMELIMYYKYDKTENGTTTRPQTTYSFALGAGNTHIGQYEYDRTGTALENPVFNENTGDEKLYMQGMGGPSIGIKLGQSTIDELKQRYKDKKAAIISAKIRIYTDPLSWNNSYAKPTAFTFLQERKKGTERVNEFTKDVFTLAAIPGYRIYNTFDLDKNPAYYEFIVTKSVKDLVEEGTESSETYSPDKYFRIDMGAFLSNAENTGLAGPKFTSRAYDINRAVFVGSDPNNAKRIQLRVLYGTK